MKRQQKSEQVKQLVLRMVLMYQQRHRKEGKQDKGFALLIAMSMILILGTLIPAYLLMSNIENSTAFYTASSNSGFYAAEAAMNLRAEAIRQKFLGYNRPIGTAATTPNNTMLACVNGTYNGSGDFDCENVNLNLNLSRTNSNTQSNSQVTAKTYVVENPKNLTTYPPVITIPAGETFQGLKAEEYLYRVYSFASRANDSNPMAILQMDFKSRLIPLFQFAAFYNNDLDFSIPPTMTFLGPIHSNNNIYLDAANGYTVTINGQVSASGSLYRGSKIDNSCNGTVNIYDPTNPTPLTCSGSTLTPYTQSGVSAWNNMIQIGGKVLTLPAPSSLDATPASGSVYWNQADLRIALLVDGTGTPIRDPQTRSFIQVQNKDGTVNATDTNNLLNTCPTNSTTLTTSSANNSTTLNVANSTGFNVGDVIQIGTESDSHVISSTNTTSTPNTITLRRLLGGGPTRSSNEPSSVAPKYKPSPPFPSNTPNTVSKAIVSTSDTFFNYREKNGGTGLTAGSYIRMLNVNIQGLLNCVQTQNLGGVSLNKTTNGGLVFFFTVKGPNSTTDVTSSSSPNTPNNYAVRVYNGATLASTVSGAPAIKGLTIVSDQAVYIVGDYNAISPALTATPAQVSAQLAQNLANEKPASFLADTINALSNQWTMDDSHSITYTPSNLPPTVPLQSSDIVLLTAVARTVTAPNTINAGFLAGTNITGGVNGTAGQNLGLTQTSGGVNNYPRFHENWSGIPFYYTGSFVSLNVPRRTNSPFCGSLSSGPTCNIYSPPVRNWNYDTNFNNAALLPPLTPRAVYLRQEGFSRSFSQ